VLSYVERSNPGLWIAVVAGGIALGVAAYFLVLHVIR
jgi:hypothetical protein